MRTIEKNDDKSPMRQTLRTPFTVKRDEEPIQFGQPNILAQSMSVEPFVRRAVKKIGWTEVQDGKCSALPNSVNFHIRFSISDLEN